ncbi:MAG TPA: tripartite tricarboxylate transporter TctB family protein [Pelomicrobium sp.]|nr:tripartite tricarboxylate transporter TctB family protein [Pelomicrobium sp.]
MTAERLKRALPYAVLLAVAGYLWYAAGRIEYFAPAGRIGPDAWPRIIILLLALTCAYGVVQALRGRTRPAQADAIVDASAGDEAQEPEEKHPLLLLLGIGATIAYVASVKTLGFFIATVIYLFAFMVIGRYRNWLVITIMSLGGSLLLVFFFMKVVYVSLPIGEEPFSAVTLFLMKVMGIK